MAYNTENPKQEKAITALLNCKTIAEAAQAAGVGERTLYNWLQEEAFQGEYRRARWQAAGQAIARLQSIASEAAGALQDVYSNKENPASARVSAARVVLELSIKAVELENLEERINQLEEAVRSSRNA